jgi:hypothetical protein
MPFCAETTWQLTTFNPHSSALLSQKTHSSSHSQTQQLPCLVHMHHTGTPSRRPHRQTSSKLLLLMSQLHLLEGTQLSENRFLTKVRTSPGCNRTTTAALRPPWPPPPSHPPTHPRCNQPQLLALLHNLHYFSHSQSHSKAGEGHHQAVGTFISLVRMSQYHLPHLPPYPP